MPQRSSLSSSETPVVRSSQWWVVGILLLGVVLLAGGFYAQKMGWVFSQTTDGYHAVFLTNGQIYFGKIANRNAAYITLTNIYYLRQNPRLQEPVPPADDKKGKKDEEQPRPPEPELSLVKLGQELHGPKDRMDINRDHILFIENLRDDGKVVQAIQRFQTKQ